MVTEEQLEVLAEILDNIESVDKVALTLDESQQSVRVEIKDIDYPWFLRLTNLIGQRG
ncbi:MAG: hypothetical protein JWR16_2482 [Nevskia sp.]|nr:hypothetical protein [Nevskia sp.]